MRLGDDMSPTQRSNFIGMSVVLVAMAIALFTISLAGCTENSTQSPSPRVLRDSALPRTNPDSILWTWKTNDSTTLPNVDPRYFEWMPLPTGNRAIRAHSPDPTSRLVSIPIDIRLWRGMLVETECQVTLAIPNASPGQNVGSACILSYQSVSRGQQWINSSSTGASVTISQKDTGFITFDAEAGQFRIGIMGTAGEAIISSIKIKAIRYSLQIPQFRTEPRQNVDVHRGSMVAFSIKEPDYAALRMLGANYVRLPISPPSGSLYARDPQSYSDWLVTNIPNIQSALDAADRNSLKVILDMHAPPGGTNSGTRSMRVFSDSVCQRIFVNSWILLASKFGKHPALLGYDLLNEPISGQEQLGVLNWWSLFRLAAQEIRKIDNVHSIVIEPDGGSVPVSFRTLVPFDIPGIIYSIHMYKPYSYTHQGIQDWAPLRSVSYPGIIDSVYTDRKTLVSILQPVRDFQLAYDVPILVGEFSALRWCPGADLYLSDLVSIFEDFGWSWSYHSFRESQMWSLENNDLPYDTATSGVKSDTLTNRMKAIMQGFLRNNQGIRL